MSQLKKYRVILAGLVYVFLSVVLLDLKNEIPEAYFDASLYLQFVPSLLKFITTLNWVVLGFAIVLVLTALFGRIYCSTLCPLGILFDLMDRIKRVLTKNKRLRYSYEKPKTVLRIAFLVIAVGSFLLGTTALVGLLDPYSNFGRINSEMIKPVISQVNNGVASVLENVDVYTVKPVPVATPKLGVLFYTLAFFCMVFYLAIKRGRLYCNTICPVGTLLGGVAHFSLLKIRITEDCISCKKCEKVCKSQCIDIDNKTVDNTRCVACFNCLQDKVCPTNSVVFSRKKLNHKTERNG
ncbi:4Fe-4S binding protein [Prolixibacteraceae bacterium JC049]|nr:4Fe-4S binding protein [Prolixibacteraceae bacterium JC049]